MKVVDDFTVYCLFWKKKNESEKLHFSPPNSGDSYDGGKSEVNFSLGYRQEIFSYNPSSALKKILVNALNLTIIMIYHF